MPSHSILPLPLRPPPPQSNFSGRIVVINSTQVTRHILFMATLLNNAVLYSQELEKNLFAIFLLLIYLNRTPVAVGEYGCLYYIAWQLLYKLLTVY
jgi:hypothetical protein